MNPKFQRENEDEQWRRIAEQQRTLKHNIIFLIISGTTLIWFFGETFANYWKTISWSETKNKVVAFEIPRVIPPQPVMPELQFPESGSIIQYQQPSGTTAKFAVVSDQNEINNCVVKLETWDEGMPAIELFVRAGEQAETQLAPLGNYRAKIACGKQWYGRNELFGRTTQISIGETPVKLWQSGNTIYGFTLTLAQKIGGNFKTNNSRFNKF